MAIAIPAIGGIFATIVTFYDGKRTKREINQKNIYAALCFGIATCKFMFFFFFQKFFLYNDEK